MIHIIKGRQRKGKTTLLVGKVVNLVEHGRAQPGEPVYKYKTSQIYSNLRLFRPDGTELADYHYMKNREIRQFVKTMVENGLNHIIIIVDEIDRVFPHRFWNSKEQTEALLGLWQDEKLFVEFFGTAHIGKGIDLIIRESMQFEYIVSRKGVNKRSNTLEYTVINILDRRIYAGVMYHVKLIQSLFKTRLPIW